MVEFGNEPGTAPEEVYLVWIPAEKKLVSKVFWNQDYAEFWANKNINSPIEVVRYAVAAGDTVGG